MPLISLVLATVGRTSELGRLFDSFAAQTFKDFEIIIVDQNTDERLQPFLDRARQLNLDVKYLKHYPANLAAARNKGIEAASSNWIGFPDDDCWYDPAVLEHLARHIQKPESPDGVIIRWVEQGEPPVVAPALSWERSRNFRDVPVSSITLFIKRSTLNAIGGFDSRFGVGQWFGAAEEHDLVLRALREGATLVYEPDAEVHHAVGPKQAPADPQARMAARKRARGTGALYAKHSLPLWVIVRGLAAPILRPLMKGSLGNELAYGFAVVLGRLDGMLGWNRRQHR
ncbi:MAG: glycosyltransferase family 2 protein [Burkholderiaceae bacterium]